MCILYLRLHQDVLELVDVFLDGSGSSDHEGQPLTYTWVGPAEIILNNETSVNANFTAPDVTEDTEYTFTLQVSDDGDLTAIDDVTILVLFVNQAPLADAGADDTVDEGEEYQLNGSGSSDPDGQDLTYAWTAPDGITLDDANIADPTFTAPDVTVDTEYTFILEINDGDDSAFDAVIIMVINTD